MILRKLANFIDFKFLNVCVQNTENFDLKIREMVKKINLKTFKTFVLKNGKKFNFRKINGGIFLFSKAKVVYCRPFS